jgi:hypothetical protein
VTGDECEGQTVFLIKFFDFFSKEEHVQFCALEDKASNGSLLLRPSVFPFPSDVGLGGRGFLFRLSLEISSGVGIGGLGTSLT